MVIQAAHEILTDAALKTKVDNYRRRPGSRFSAASGVKGNPYQDLAKEMADRFGAPPTRPAQPAARPPPAPSASRYAGWGVPPTAKQKTADATDNLRAWDRMRTASGRGNQSTGPSPTKTQPPPPPPRTASQARRQEAAFGSPTKKTGYAPKSPMGGDEPPVTNRNGYTNIHSRMFEETAANMRRSRPESTSADPLSTQFGENWADDRQRTPYASHIGEKTNPFEGVGVNRAKSARDAFRGHSDDSDTPPSRPQRHRSASVDESDRFKKPNEKEAYSGSSANTRQQSRASARYSPPGAATTSAPSSATFEPSSNGKKPADAARKFTMPTSEIGAGLTTAQQQETETEMEELPSPRMALQCMMTHFLFPQTSVILDFLCVPVPSHYTRQVVVMRAILMVVVSDILPRKRKTSVTPLPVETGRQIKA